MKIKPFVLAAIFCLISFSWAHALERRAAAPARPSAGGNNAASAPSGGYAGPSEAAADRNDSQPGPGGLTPFNETSKAAADPEKPLVVRHTTKSALKEAIEKRLAEKNANKPLVSKEGSVAGSGSSDSSASDDSEEDENGSATTDDTDEAEESSSVNSGVMSCQSANSACISSAASIKEDCLEKAKKNCDEVDAEAQKICADDLSKCMAQI